MQPHSGEHAAPARDRTRPNDWMRRAEVEIDVLGAAARCHDGVVAGSARRGEDWLCAFSCQAAEEGGEGGGESVVEFLEMRVLILGNEETQGLSIGGRGDERNVS